MSLAEAGFEGATAEPAACAHCGLPVPDGDDDGPMPFCCSGCRTAWDVLHDAGLGHYYALAERRAERVRPSGRAFEEFDHAAFRELHVHAMPDGLEESRLYLEGVHCASCVWLVERTPLALPGLVSAELDLVRGLVRVRWNPERARLSSIARFLDTLGYRPHPFRGARADELRRREDRAMLVRVGIAGALAANTMLVALALYAGWFDGMESDVTRYLRGLSLALAVPAVFGPGAVFFRSAWGALRARALHMDVPIALALGAGFLRGAVNTVTDRGPIYLDGVVMLIFLLLVGRMLQQRAARAAADSAELLGGLAPSHARLVESGTVRDVPAEALVPGMVVEVRAGDSVPADGIVTSGEGDLDLALLTGESRPVIVRAGDAAWAGAVLRGTWAPERPGSGTVRLRVTHAGEATRVGRLLRDVEAGARRRAPIVRTADRLSTGFVAVVLVLAAVTWLMWRAWDPDAALDHAIALLIVTCPCALALATPLAVTVAIGRAAGAGILIKGGDALEALARPGTLVLDKTGTLTEGRLTLHAWQGPDELRGAVLALERHATHPIARALEAAWPELAVPEAEGVQVAIGGGVVGRVGGRLVAAGSPAWIAERAAGVAPHEAGDQALTPILVARDGQVVARATFGDPVRAEALPTLTRLRAAGWSPRLLSGDDEGVVQHVGTQLAFLPADCHARATPETKLAEIARLAAAGPVVMVGDGVNDAAAIARATVGVSVRGGAEASLAACDVFLAEFGIGSLVALTEGARRTLATIRTGLAVSLAYNVGGAALAMAGLLPPWLAAILMPVSSLTVVAIAWRSRTFVEARP